MRFSHKTSALSLPKEHDEYITKLEQALTEPPNFRLPTAPGDPTKIKLYEDSNNGVYSGQEAKVTGIIYIQALHCKNLSRGYLVVKVDKNISPILVRRYCINKYKILESVPYPGKKEK
jgi:hypothetical protein